MITDILAFVRVLSDAGVDYVIVDGVAANIHGALCEALAELEALLEERDRT
jgi:hypothetical protein